MKYVRLSMNESIFKGQSVVFVSVSFFVVKITNNFNALKKQM